MNLHAREIREEYSQYTRGDKSRTCRSWNSKTQSWDAACIFVRDWTWTFKRERGFCGPPDVIRNRNGVFLDCKKGVQNRRRTNCSVSGSNSMWPWHLEQWKLVSEVSENIRVPIALDVLSFPRPRSCLKIFRMPLKKKKEVPLRI